MFKHDTMERYVADSLAAMEQSEQQSDSFDFFGSPVEATVLPFEVRV